MALVAFFGRYTVHWQLAYTGVSKRVSAWSVYRILATDIYWGLERGWYVTGIPYTVAGIHDGL